MNLAAFKMSFVSIPREHSFSEMMFNQFNSFMFEVFLFGTNSPDPEKLPM